MKKYVKPQMIIEEFRADESICTCTDEKMLERYVVLRDWREWKDENPKNGKVEENEIGAELDSGDFYIGQQFIVFTRGLFREEIDHGTIINTAWEGGPITGHLNIYYRNAS